MDKEYVLDLLYALGLNQRDLACALLIDPAGVSYLLNGKRQLKAKEVIPMAHFLRVSSADILNNLHKD
jgi:transcriptional regulator with XRE-family HTH domain